MPLIELTATLFGLLCVWLTVRQNIWCWPAGLVQVVLYIWIFYHARLYSDMACTSSTCSSASTAGGTGSTATAATNSRP